MWCRVVTVVLLFGSLTLPSSCLSTSLFALQDGSYTSSCSSDLCHTNRIGSATFETSIHLTGWDELTLYMTNSASDDQMAFAAGWMEGALTASQISSHYANTIKGSCDQTPVTCDRIKRYISVNKDWVTPIASNFLDSPFWYQVHLFYKQMEGIYKGYNSSNATKIPLTYDDILWINMAMDIENLKLSLAIEAEKKFIQVLGHSSAVIKLSSDHKNIFFGHNTWMSYSYMNRIVKRYYIPYRKSKGSKETVPGASFLFSSYPGRIYSMDDYYIIGSGLVTMGTKNYVYNASIHGSNLWTLGSVRTMVANRLASKGEEWSSYFSFFSSGTYNSQWMILDLKTLIHGDSDLNKDLLHVVEEMPDRTISADQSKVLTSEGYWASYNIPFYPYIYELSGTNDMYLKFGNQFSHGECPRAKIFKREVSKVKDMDSLMTLLRYNHYLTDSASYCEKCNPHTNPQDSIASRFDLVPVNGTQFDGKYGHLLYGAIDAKGSSLELWKQGSMLLEAGPTHDGLPVFKWSSSPTTLPHEGIPDVADFPRITARFEINSSLPFQPKWTNLVKSWDHFQ